MRAEITCHYCDKTWDQYVYNHGKASLKCSKCGETKNFTIKELTTNMVNYYEGSPDFSETKHIDEA